MTDHSVDTDLKFFDISRNLGSWIKTLHKDRVVRAFTAMLAGIWIFNTADTMFHLLGRTGESLVSTAPFIAASVLIAVYVKASGAAMRLSRSCAA